MEWTLSSSARAIWAEGVEVFELLVRFCAFLDAVFAVADMGMMPKATVPARMDTSSAIPCR